MELIIEKAGDVDVTASAVVAAVQAYAKINTAREWIDRTENVSLNERTGDLLPGWFRITVGVTEC